MRNSKEIQISREDMKDFFIPTDHIEDIATFLSFSFASSHQLVDKRRLHVDDECRKKRETKNEGAKRRETKESSG